MRELLIEIWMSVRKNKLRTFLTGFSVAWGIFMLVILLGSSNGFKNAAISSFGSQAINSIELYGGTTSKPYMGYDKNRGIKLCNNDLQVLKKEFPEIDEIAANFWFNGSTVTYGKEFIKVWLRGSLPKIEQIEDVKIIKGRFINDSDLKYCRKSIVIDEIMQTILFKEADPLGEKIKVGSSMFTVVGVYKGDATRSTSASFIPLTTGQLIYKANDQHVSQAILTVKNIDSDEKMKAFEQRVVRRLSIEHHFDPTDMSAIWLYNRMEDYKDAMMVFIGINIFVWIIGLGTLLSGVVGVSNIMLVTVTERTAEFGIRKSLGAKPSSIVRLILTESVLVTSIFGYVGMVLGVAVMEVVNYYIVNAPLQESEGFNETIFIDPTLDISVAVSATLVLVLAGLIAGYIPANRAAKLKTIDALRYNK